MDEYDSDSQSYSASSSRHSEESSNEYEDAEWLQHVSRDGSLLYVESYVSSTVREKQVQALKASGSADRKTPFTPPPKDIKKKNKLMRLLKRRPSVRVKGAGRSGGGAEGGAKGGPDFSPPKVTFRDNPSGEVRKVMLQVYEGGSNLGRRASLCETVLGIIPGRFNEPPYTRVMVAGLLPGSQALKNGAIKIGDWLKEVEETDVTWDNLDDVLAELQIPSMISLSVQKCASETLPDEMDNDHKRVTQTQLVRVMTGSSPGPTPAPSPAPHLSRLPHTALYLSLAGVTEDSPDGADIRYQFPGWSNKLVQVRGMFITAAHTVQEVVGCPALCSTVCLDGEYYHVAYVRENNDVFLLALPHSYVLSHDLVALMEQLATLIRFQFATLARGLGSGKNKPYMDHLFSLVLGGMLGGGTGGRGGGSWATLNPYLPQLVSTPESFVLARPAWLPLHHAPEAKLQIDNCLSELESGDFGDDDSDYEDSLSLYSILGSCLFYKGHLVASHLSSEELRRVWLVAQHHGLLRLTTQEAVSQLVAWRRVYPPSINSPTSPHDHTAPTHYLLLVAMNHCMLGLLLEAGGITDVVEEGAGPDPFLVDQVEASLYQLHALHIHTLCEESLMNAGIETVAADDKFGRGTPSKKSKDRHDPTEGGLRLPDVPSILKQKSSGGSGEVRLEVGLVAGAGVGECEGSTSGDSFTPSSHDSSFQHDDEHHEEGEEEEEEEEDGEEEDSDWRIYKPSESRVLTQYDCDISPALPRPVTSPIRVTSGKESALFHLVQLEVGEGVLIQTQPPSSYSSSSLGHSQPPPPPLHAQVLHNFRSTCAHIHHLLHAPARYKESGGGYGSSPALSGIREHGVLFTYTPPPSPAKRRANTFSYWVVGRVLGGPYQREVYVCYHEAIPQNLLELAFRVSHGSVI
ncbi:hypothetical protein Pcinc_015568 [Petrolisthes cinctipes]|uniref:Protein inturned n=1 Tax=Petrolisthes cinctipes TaxID=88211 RepID=A0AAE1FU83_PETCI|nr:hypothetical protein Pcinc_015568 [Petrolisthes cinctipes]